MTPGFNDPHNHVPEVSSDDVWGDAVALAPNPSGHATVLPPKRPKAPDSPPPTRNSMTGLRIESQTQNRPAYDVSSHQLEVQEIDGSVVRLDPEPPEVEKIPRQFTFRERPAATIDTSENRGEGPEWGHARKYPIRWMLGASAAVAAVVVTSMGLLPLVNKSNAARPIVAETPWVQSKESIKGAATLNDMLGRKTEADQILRKYLTATIVDEIIPLTRDPKTVEPLIREIHRPMRVPKAWAPTQDTNWSVKDTDGSLFGLLEGTLPDFSRIHAYFVLSENHLFLDWKATTGFGTATFDDLERNQGDPSEIRATLIPSDYYTNIFPEEKYQSYQLVAPDQLKAIWCYALHDSDEYDKIRRMFQGGEILKSTPEPQKLTLRLARGPEGSLLNQWLIADILHKDWITP